jgi:DeoR/GlpR family transcriptional regulator of sugar metabolism
MTNSAIRHAGAQERRARILSQLRLLGFLSITELARDLGVSSMTVRRDLQVLEASENVRLVHGGASLSPSALHGVAFPRDRLGAARGRVAELAAELVGATDTIALDAGPTSYALARALPESFSGSVITHSMPVVALLAEQPTGARLVALGGELRADRHAFVGPSTEAALAGLRARTVFLEPAAVDARGLYAGSPAEASLQRRLMDIADDVVMIGTSGVTRSSAPALITSLDHVTRFVTDGPVPAELGSALRRSDVMIHSSCTNSGKLPGRMFGS